MTILNPFELGRAQNILFFMNLLQIAGLVEYVSKFVHTILSKWNYIKFHNAGIVIMFIAGFLAISGIVTAVLSIVGCFQNKRKLLVPNIVYCLLLYLPVMINIIYNVGHPYRGSYDTIISLVNGFNATCALLAGVPAYNECKRGEQTERITTGGIANLAASP